MKKPPAPALFPQFLSNMTHSSELRGFCSNKSSSETLQKLQMNLFFNKKTNSMNRHSKLLEMKNEKKYLFVFFFIPKIWEMLKDFSRVFRRAQTLKF